MKVIAKKFINVLDIKANHVHIKNEVKKINKFCNDDHNNFSYIKVVYAVQFGKLISLKIED